MHNDDPQTPLLQEGTATFIWNGPEPPGLIGDFNQWEVEKSPTFERIGPGQWATTIQLPPDAYIEYAFQLSDDRTPSGQGLDGCGPF